MMAFAGHRVFPIRQKKCLAYSLIRYNQHLFLTIWQYLQYEWWSEWLKNQTEKTTVVEWNEDMVV